MKIDSLAIELTRQCNLKCRHCMRGDQQNNHMTYPLIHRIAINLQSVGVKTLSFTGGEISLATLGLAQFIHEWGKHNLQIENFYMTLNGVHPAGPTFLSLLVKMYNLCLSNEFTQVQISETPWHYEQRGGPGKPGLLDTLNFFSYRGIDEIIQEGRAKDHPEFKDQIHGFLSNVKVSEDLHVTGDVYINTSGQVINGCDWSYQSQPEHVLGSLDAEPLTTILKRRIPCQSGQ